MRRRGGSSSPTNTHVAERTSLPPTSLSRTHLSPGPWAGKTAPRVSFEPPPWPTTTLSFPSTAPLFRLQFLRARAYHGRYSDGIRVDGRQPFEMPLFDQVAHSKSLISSLYECLQAASTHIRTHSYAKCLKACPRTIAAHLRTLALSLQPCCMIDHLANRRSARL